MVVSEVFPYEVMRLVQLAKLNYIGIIIVTILF